MWLSYKPNGVDSQSLGDGEVGALSLKCLPSSLDFLRPLETSRILENERGTTSSSGKSVFEWDITGEECPQKISIESMPDLDSLPVNTSSFMFDVPCYVSEKEMSSCGATAK